MQRTEENKNQRSSEARQQKSRKMGGAEKQTSREAGQTEKQERKHPGGPETVLIRRMFFKQMVILPQCRADLMIGSPGKTWGAFFGFSASSAA